MGNHFREQEDFASTRRGVLKGVLAGAAAGVAVVPAVAREGGQFDHQPREAATYHAVQLCKAMQALHPEKRFSVLFGQDAPYVLIATLGKGALA